MPRPKLLFVATEDWFFASHFLPMARAARELGFDVAVIARERNHRRVIEATGARLIGLEAERRSLDPRALFKQIGALKRLIAAEKPDILHCIALKPIALAGLAGVSEVAGRTGYVTLDMSPGYGYSGIVIAMLAGLNPLGVVAAAVFVAGVLVGADSMSRAVNVPTYIADMIVAVSLIAVLIAGAAYLLAQNARPRRIAPSRCRMMPIPRRI